MISVVMVTNRAGAPEYLMHQLEKQTFKDFEVIIADDLTDKTGNHFKPRQKEPGEVWNLNKAYNDALSKVSGELIVFIQDYIWLKANALQRFWDVYQMYPNALVTGCGHKAATPDTLPIDPAEMPKGISEFDDRCFGVQGVVPSDWTFYELNYASCPTSCLVSFEEDMDKHYGGENQVFALKASIERNADVLLDRANQCIGLNQSIWPRQKDWEENHANKGFLNQKITSLINKYKHQ